MTEDVSLLVMRLAFVFYPIYALSHSTELGASKPSFPAFQAPHLITFAAALLLAVGLQTRVAALSMCLGLLIDRGHYVVRHLAEQGAPYLFTHHLRHFLSVGLPFGLALTGAGKLSVDGFLSKFGRISSPPTETAGVGFAIARIFSGSILLSLVIPWFWFAEKLSRLWLIPVAIGACILTFGVQIGITLILGYKTRSAAISVAAFLIIEHWAAIVIGLRTYHHTEWPILRAIGWIFPSAAFLAIGVALKGAGPYSLDAKLAKAPSLETPTLEGERS